MDAALRGGASLRSIAKSFGVGRTALTGHAAKHTKAAETRKFRVAARGGGRRKPGAPLAVVEPVAIDTPADVLTELRFLYGETKSLYELAKASRDTRLMDKAITAGAALLDRFARSFGMFQDGSTTVNIDARTQKVAAFYDSLPTETLRQLADGKITIDAVVDAVAGASS